TPCPAQLTAASQQHRRTVSEQSTAVNETTATAAELAASQKQVMQTAATVSQVGVKAADAVDYGQHALDRTLHGLNDIKAKTEASSTMRSGCSGMWRSLRSLPPGTRSQWASPIWVT